MAPSLGIGALALGLAFQVGAVAAQPGKQDEPDRSSVRLVAESTALVPGTTTMLAAVFDIDEGWHTYADAQNDSGSPLIATWSLPPGVEVGEPIWTASHRHVAPGEILDHIYEGSVTILFPLTVTDKAAPTSDAVISASLEWLVCDSNRCVPQFAEASLELPVQSTADRGPDAPLIDKARQKLGTLATGARNDAVILRWEGDTLIAECMLGYAAEFIPGPGCPPVTDLLQNGYSERGLLRLPFEFENHPDSEVVGWVRLLKPETQSPPPVQSTLYLVRLDRGKSPRKILGE